MESLLALGFGFWLLLLGWGGLSFIVGLMAAALSRNGILFFVISLVVSPVLAGILLMAMGKKQKSRSQTVKVQCPSCRSVVDEASFCPECGNPLPEVEGKHGGSKKGKQVATKPKKDTLSGVGILLSGALIFLCAWGGAFWVAHYYPGAEEKGLVSGLLLGIVLAYIVKKAFPEQMTNR